MNITEDLERLRVAINAVNATKCGSPEGGFAQAVLDSVIREMRIKHGMGPHWSPLPVAHRR